MATAELRVISGGFDINKQDLVLEGRDVVDLFAVNIKSEAGIAKVIHNHQDEALGVIAYLIADALNECDTYETLRSRMYSIGKGICETNKFKD